MVIRQRNGMQPKRHRSLSAAGVTHFHSDPELIERVRRERKRLFDTEQLPDHLRYTVEEYDS